MRASLAIAVALGLLSPPAAGADAALAQEPLLQDRARALLESRGVELGHVVLMSPQTGELFAYVSTDPDRFPATRAYPAASLMKVVTAAALARRAPHATREPCAYAGNPYRLTAAGLEAPPGTARLASFRDALALSNNQCFARLAVGHLAPQSLQAEIRRTGLLEPPAPGHAPGRVEAPASPLALGRLASGLAGSFITPLAAARLAALLARGELVIPHAPTLGEGIPRGPAPPAGALPPTGPTAASPPLQVWPRELADRLRALLVSVTERGTARSAFRDARGQRRLGPVRVAGKTGTLTGSDPSGLYRWFIGVAPAEAPRLALAVLVVGEQHSAAELAASLLEEVFCAQEVCTSAGAEGLHARARARARAHARALVGMRAADPGAMHQSEGAREATRKAMGEASREPVREPIHLWVAHRGDEGGPTAQESADPPALDALPRPRAGTRLELPPRLRGEKTRGEIVLLLELSPEGTVLEARVDSSDLPALEDTVLRQVRGWAFTPPRRDGSPVRATARLPIAIDIH